MLSVLSSFVHAAKYISMKGEIFNAVLKVDEKEAVDGWIGTSSFLAASFKVNFSAPVLSSLKALPQEFFGERRHGEGSGLSMGVLRFSGSLTTFYCHEMVLASFGVKIS